MTVVDAKASWAALFAEVPRAAFIPDTIWVDNDSGDALVALSKHTDPDGWHAVVSANAPVITQVNLGDVQPGQKGSFPSSSCSQPTIVADMLDALDAQPGQSVLEIGTGTGWNAALLSRCVGEHGRVVTIEVDTRLAQDARRTLTNAGYDPLVITGDGMAGYSAGAPYDRVVCTASIRELVPRAWLDQLRPAGRLVTPWGTDWSNGVMLTLTLAEDGIATGRFSGDLAFMRVRGQRRALYGWQPADSDIECAQISTTECRGSDLDRMLNPAKGRFAIGARLASCCLVIEWDKHGELHHNLELDDGATKSWAQLDADLNDPAPFTVRQLGPRKLWDEAEAAYDWWYEQGEPGLDRFGFHSRDRRQWVWLDEPNNIVRVLN
ncbi:MAG TPA: methyltransferase domain-containing protein [Pseudonocardiaceae bacterium]|nr:methyltransferase domain-containing protein [Pseudonocardiaceae bacterium]